MPIQKINSALINDSAITEAKIASEAVGLNALTKNFAVPRTTIATRPNDPSNNVANTHILFNDDTGSLETYYGLHETAGTNSRRFWGGLGGRTLIGSHTGSSAWTALTMYWGANENDVNTLDKPHDYWMYEVEMVFPDPASATRLALRLGTGYSTGTSSPHLDGDANYNWGGAWEFANDGTGRTGSGGSTFATYFALTNHNSTDTGYWIGNNGEGSTHITLKLSNPGMSYTGSSAATFNRWVVESQYCYQAAGSGYGGGGGLINGIWNAQSSVTENGQTKYPLRSLQVYYQDGVVSNTNGDNMTFLVNIYGVVGTEVKNMNISQ
jgi:hypothetical protein